jgi:hypothetical protein
MKLLERGTYVTKMVPKSQISDMIKDDQARVVTPILLWDPYALNQYEGILLDNLIYIYSGWLPASGEEPCPRVHQGERERRRVTVMAQLFKLRFKWSFKDFNREFQVKFEN